MKEKLKALFVYFFGKKPDPKPETKAVKSEQPNNNSIWLIGDPATSVPMLIHETKVSETESKIRELPKKESEWDGWTKQELQVEDVKKTAKKTAKKPSTPVKAPSNKPANKKPRNRVKKATPAKTS